MDFLLGILTRRARRGRGVNAPAFSLLSVFLYLTSGGVVGFSVDGVDLLLIHDVFGDYQESIVTVAVL